MWLTQQSVDKYLNGSWIITSLFVVEKIRVESVPGYRVDIWWWRTNIISANIENVIYSLYTETVVA